MAVTIQVRRGTKAELDGITLAAGELGLTTDTKELWIGDGSNNLAVGRCLIGTLASRPSAGESGRFYWATDNSTLYVDDGDSWETVASSAVDSVFSRTGSVVAAASDYDASQVDNDSNVSGSFVDDALNTLYTRRVDKNAIINGDMRIAQRGTSFPGMTLGYTLDRWKYSRSGITVHTVTQENKTASDANTPTEQFENSIKLDCTTADASIAAGDYSILYQSIEGYNFKKFVDQTATLSFWIKAGKTGTMCIGFGNSVGDRSYVAEVTINVANTWEKKTITLDFDYSGGTWDYINGAGLYLYFTLMAGSTYQTTADAWQTGNYFATSNQTNFCDNADATCDVYITGIQLELGDTATDFEFLDFGTELALCERYYTKGDGWDSGLLWSGYCRNGSNYYVNKVFSVEMRVAPSITLTNFDSSGFTTATSSAAITKKGFRGSRASNADTNGGYAVTDWVADAEL